MAEPATASHRLDRPLRFDLESAAFKRDPFPVFAAMRAAGPAVPVRIPFFGAVWVTTTHQATLAMVKDNSRFVQQGRNAGKSGVAGLRWWMPSVLRLLANNMLQKDEPDHRRLRGLVDRAFARRDVLAMRGAIETVADKLLDDIGTATEVDLVDTFCRRLPLEVISELLGLPGVDRPMFAAMTSKAMAIKGPLSLVGAAGAFSGMAGYMRGQIADCRRQARPGLIGELVLQAQDGDALDENELLSMIFLLLVAGFETTTHLIETSIVALDQNPDQKAWLLADPEARMERAVEELARFTSPVQSTKPRFVAAGGDFLGQNLKRGELILGLVSAANADPARFDHPEQLRLDRFPNPHLVFSSGVHFCLGMQLARVEVQSALARLYGRFPDLAVPPPDRLEWVERFGIRGLKRLPTRLNAAQARLAA